MVHPFKETIVSLYSVASSPILILRYVHVLYFIIIYFSSNKEPVFFSSAQYAKIISINQRSCVPFNFNPSWFTSTLHIA